MRLVFAGTPAVAVPALEVLAASEHELVAVVTRPDALSGRGRRRNVSSVATAAADLGVPILKPENPSDPDFLTELRRLAPEVCPVVAYGVLVPPAALEIPLHGWVNLHFSLLPAWRGAAPVQHALLAGDDLTGATTFQIEKGLDTGPWFGMVTEPTHPTDIAGDLLNRLSISGAQLLLRTLDAIAVGAVAAQPQRGEGVSYAPKLTVDDVRVDWTKPAIGVDRLIRAATPAPGAWTVFRGERLKLLPVSITAVGGADPVVETAAAAQVSGRLESGELRVAKTQVLVGTGSVPVALGLVQAVGKKPMPAADWARGARPRPGERFD